MAEEAAFNTALADAQSTRVEPVAPGQFDFEAYQEYENKMQERNREFVRQGQGLLVYRRVRANGVFYDKCRDYRESLALQLGALTTGMAYPADIANFLEPWYGIGYIAASFGGSYRFCPGQAPDVKPMFASAREILDSDFVSISSTPEGKYQLEMLEYFMEQSKGRIPISYGDVQSPLNMLTYLMPAADLFMEIYDDPDSLREAAMLCGQLLTGYLMEQKKLIGDSLASPGHGFASSRSFTGVGLSDDTSIMVSEDDYRDIFQAADEQIGEAFGGIAYHSCGVWERKIKMVKGMKNIRCADGAFSAETDPSPNDPAVFGEAFAGSGIVLNARAVGNPRNCLPVFEKLWQPDQKLICVTYCETVEEQAYMYKRLHEMERQR